METHADHDRVLRVPAGQRLLRAAVLLGGRAARHQGAVGRRHRHRVLVRVPCAGQPGVLLAASRRAEDARRRLQHRHGRVTDCHHRVHAPVQGRRGPALRHGAHRRVHLVRVFRPVSHFASTLDAVQRSVPDGRQRYEE